MSVLVISRWTSCIIFDKSKKSEHYLRRKNLTFEHKNLQDIVTKTNHTKSMEDISKLSDSSSETEIKWTRQNDKAKYSHSIKRENGTPT